MISPELRERATELIELTSGFRTGRAITTAVQLGLFSRLSASAHTANELAEDDENVDGIHRLCRLLASIELLNQQNDSFALTETSRMLLSEQAAFDIRPMLRLHHRVYELWTQLRTVIQTGERPATLKNGKPFFDASFAEAMEVRGQLTAEELAEALAPVLDNGRMLDLGAGSGTHARALLRKCPDARATITDLPDALEVARRSLDEDLEDRLDLEPLDVTTPLDYQSAYDLVLISAVIRLFGADIGKQIINGAYRALRAGGWIGISDLFPPERDPWTEDAAMFDLMMLLATREGTIHSEEQYRAWLDEAGFANIQHKHRENGLDVILGQKPE